MNHLSDFTINEYLDDALDAPARRAAETHLAACPACRARLDDLRFVFVSLERVADLRLHRDLTPAIMANLPRKAGLRFRQRALAAQGGVALGFALWLGAFLAALRPPTLPALPLPDLPTLQLPALLPLFPLDLFTSPLPNVLTFHIPDLPTLPLPTLPAFHPLPLLTAILASFALWLIGNRILLRTLPERR